MRVAEITGGDDAEYVVELPLQDEVNIDVNTPFIRPVAFVASVPRRR